MKQKHILYNLENYLLYFIMKLSSILYKKEQDEYKTICKCTSYNSSCKKIIIRKNPIPYKNCNVFVHWALNCKYKVI